MNATRQFLMAGAALALASGAYAADWYVSAGMDYGADVVDAAHRKDGIQAAINSAASGDTIWVADGFVCDSGTTESSGANYRLACGGKSLTIRAEGGDWRTGPTIRGSHDESAPVACLVKTAVNAKLKIIGFNFEDGYLASENGAGVHGNGGSASAYNTTLRNCRFSNCRASRGGGAFTADAYNCVFVGNFAVNGGGGAFTCNLYGCALTNNVQEGGTSSISGGGGLHTGMASNCVFTGNSSYAGGGANAVDIFRCTFDGNTAGSVGGGASGGDVWDSVFIANHAGTRGGGKFGGTTISNCVFASNSATGYGGGIALQSISTAVIRNCVITNNVAAETGGGVSCSITGSALFDCLVADNVATNNGGGTFGATLVDCVVTGNVSVSGYGGGACGGTFARRCLFASNSAKNGGGGICAVTAADCEIVGNTASSQGGGIRGTAGQENHTTVESLFVTNCVVAGNTLTSSAASIGGAGAFGATLVGCVVSNNWSECWTGGGLYRCNSINTLVVGNICAFDYGNNNRGGGGVCGGTHYNALIAGNTSWGGGGGALSATLVNCTVVANTNASTKATLAGGCGACNVVNTVSWGNVGGNDDGLRGHVATNSISAVLLVSYGPGNSSDDPLLRAESRGPYVPAVNSPCRNNGLVQEWMADRDDVRSRALGGRARIVGSAPDIGAYEAGLDGTRLSIR